MKNHEQRLKRTGRKETRTKRASNTPRCTETHEENKQKRGVKKPRNNTGKWGVKTPMTNETKTGRKTNSRKTENKGGERNPRKTRKNEPIQTNENILEAMEENTSIRQPLQIYNTPYTNL